MTKARKRRRAARKGGGGGEEVEAREPRISRWKQRRAEREEEVTCPSLKEFDWKLRRTYAAMTISQLEGLLEKYGDKPKFAQRVRMINAVLKTKRRKTAAKPANTSEGEQPAALPRRKSRLLGYVESEIYLFRTRKRK